MSLALLVEKTPYEVNSLGRYSIFMVCQNRSPVGKGQARWEAEARTSDRLIGMREVFRQVSTLSRMRKPRQVSRRWERSPGTATIQGQGEFGVKEIAQQDFRQATGRSGSEVTGAGVLGITSASAPGRTGESQKVSRSRETELFRRHF